MRVYNLYLTFGLKTTITCEFDGQADDADRRHPCHLYSGRAERLGDEWTSTE